MGLVLALLVFLGDALVVLVVLRLGVDVAGEKQAVAVGRELGLGRAGRQRRRPERLAAAGEIEHPDLRNLVVAYIFDVAAGVAGSADAPLASAVAVTVLAGTLPSVATSQRWVALSSFL